jgi:CRP-like cAMP-binding protein
MTADRAFAEIVKLIFAKVLDERMLRAGGGYRRQFWVGLTERNDASGQAQIAARIRRLFDDLKRHRDFTEVFRQGDIGDRIYFVIDGDGEVEIDGRVTHAVGPGSVFGEIALMNESARTATIRARTAMNLASVEREAFHTLVAHFPGVRAAMDEILAAHTAMPTSPAPSTLPLPSAAS